MHNFFSALHTVLYNKNIEGYKGFITKSYQIIDYVILKTKNKEVTTLQNSHIKEIESGILTWKKNKYFGGGIKSFYYLCSIKTLLWTIRGH